MRWPSSTSIAPLCAVCRQRHLHVPSQRDLVPASVRSARRRAALAPRMARGRIHGRVCALRRADRRLVRLEHPQARRGGGDERAARARARGGGGVVCGDRRGHEPVRGRDGAAAQGGHLHASHVRRHAAERRRRAGRRGARVLAARLGRHRRDRRALPV